MWFGDERGYNATPKIAHQLTILLWFGDERGYNATDILRPARITGCGLVMKEDITQLMAEIAFKMLGCGLVMKEDITQQAEPTEAAWGSCGLVMKEDITQHPSKRQEENKVVVW